VKTTSAANKVDLLRAATVQTHLTHNLTPLSSFREWNWHCK